MEKWTLNCGVTKKATVQKKFHPLLDPLSFQPFFARLLQFHTYIVELWKDARIYLSFQENNHTKDGKLKNKNVKSFISSMKRSYENIMENLHLKSLNL